MLIILFGASIEPKLLSSSPNGVLHCIQCPLSSTINVCSSCWWVNCETRVQLHTAKVATDELRIDWSASLAAPAYRSVCTPTGIVQSAENGPFRMWSYISIAGWISGGARQFLALFMLAHSKPPPTILTHKTDHASADHHHLRADEMRWNSFRFPALAAGVRRTTVVCFELCIVILIPETIKPSLTNYRLGRATLQLDQWENYIKPAVSDVANNWLYLKHYCENKTKPVSCCHR